jgi:hypothetical protein
MQKTVPQTPGVYLKNKGIHKLRLTHDREDDRIIPHGYDIDAVCIAEWPEDLAYVHLYIGGSWVAKIQKGQNLPKIYTSLLTYLHVDLGFEFDDHGWTDAEFTRTKEVIGEDYVEIFDGQDYHTGKRVTYELVPYMGTERTVTIPEISLDLSRNYKDTTVTDVKVPVRQFVTNIDAKTRPYYEQSHDLTMVSETSGWVTNYIRYKDGFASLMYAL